MSRNPIEDRLAEIERWLTRQVVPETVTVLNVVDALWLLAQVRACRAALRRVNAIMDASPAAIVDTIWENESRTLYEFIEAVLAGQEPK